MAALHISESTITYQIRYEFSFLCGEEKGHTENLVWLPKPKTQGVERHKFAIGFSTFLSHFP